MESETEASHQEAGDSYVCGGKEERHIIVVILVFEKAPEGNERAT